jgi:hypothetical protein
MEAWSLNRYVKPCLQVDRIGRASNGTVVTVTAGPETYRFACDTVGNAKRIEAGLEKLRDPNTSVWRALRKSRSNSDWAKIATFLDARSLIADTENATIELRREAAGIVDRTAQAAAATLEHLGSKDRSRIRGNATAVLDRVLRPSDEFIHVQPNICAASVDRNFYLGVLKLELSYMRRSAPIAFRAAIYFLSKIAGRHPPKGALASKIVEEIGWHYDERDFNSHLTLVAHCILRSIDDAAARFPSPSLPHLRAASGLDFMRKVEVVTRTALKNWGPNRYLTATSQLMDIGSPLAAGCYIEEHHVTRRFVEIISPALCKRLSEPLRKLMFRYYSEELGHEEFERATCAALGVTHAALDCAVSLPLHFAFVDALTEASEQDIIAFFSVIMVTEGMLGDSSILADRLTNLGKTQRKFSKVSRKHDQLNQDLHHASIARLLFEEIPLITVKRQQRALNWLLFLLELNHRAWDAVADFYGPQERLSMHGFLGRPVTRIRMDRAQARP